MSNMRQIAKLAGVALGTVSMALRNDPRVRPDTRARIHAIASECGYLFGHEHRHAQKSGLLGIVLHHPLGPFYANILQGVLKQAYRHNLQVVVVQIERNSGTHAMMAIESLLEHHVEGLVLAAAAPDSLPRELLLKIKSAGVAPVWVMENMFTAPCDRITSSETVQARLIADYLWAFGHRVVAYLGNASASSSHRCHALVSELKQAGLHCRVLGDVEAPDDYAAALASLSHAVPRPTAVIAYHDPIAGRLMQLALRQGMHIPHDLSIVGFGNTVGDLLLPTLTTVEQFPELIGAEAVMQIGKRAAEGTRDAEYAAETIYVPPRLLIRESSGPAPRM